MSGEFQHACSLRTRRWGHAVAVAGAVLYVVAQFLPFVHGTVHLLVIPISRTLTLPAFMSHLVHDQPLLVAALVVLVMYVAPVLLLVSALTGAWTGRREPSGVLAAGLSFLRWRGWVVAGLGIVFTSGLRAASSASGGPSLRLLPGVWCFCAAVVLGSLAMVLLAPCRVRIAPPGEPDPVEGLSPVPGGDPD